MGVKPSNRCAARVSPRGGAALAQDPAPSRACSRRRGRTGAPRMHPRVRPQPASAARVRGHPSHGLSNATAPAMTVQRRWCAWASSTRFVDLRSIPWLLVACSPHCQRAIGARSTAVEVRSHLIKNEPGPWRIKRVCRMACAASQLRTFVSSCWLPKLEATVSASDASFL